MNSFKHWQDYYTFAIKVKRKNRYLLDDESRKFLETLLHTSKKRIHVFKKNQLFYRSQIGCEYVPHYQDGIYIDDFPTPFQFERMKPLKDFAREGRINPKGIPVLYLSTDIPTAIAESRPLINSYISLANIKTTKELKIVDFSKDEGHSSLLFMIENPDQQKIENAVWGDLNQAFSKPLTNADSRAEYAPSQIICEFLKSNGFDGIAYKSSLEEGYNIALFDLNVASVERCTVFKMNKIKYDAEEELNPYSVRKNDKSKFGFKEISQENWFHQDELIKSFVKINPSGGVDKIEANEWVDKLYGPKLSETVPENIHKLFEVARGALVYGYFFYPLYTLATEQLFRVTEAAINYKCEKHGAPKSRKTYEKKIIWLADNKVLQKDEIHSWHILRKFRNSSSHPNIQDIMPPGLSFDLLETVTEKINILFKE